MADGKTILIIDDDAFYVSLITPAFEKHGYQLVSATTAEAGFAAAHDNKPDLILLDLKMKGTDGYGALGALKSDPDTMTLPIVVLTSVSETEETERWKAAGVLDYLIKMEFTPDELAQRMKQYLPA